MGSMCDVVIRSTQVCRLTNEGLNRRHIAEVPQQQEQSIILIRTQCILVLQEQLNTDQDSNTLEHTAELTFYIKMHIQKNMTTKDNNKQTYLVSVYELANRDVDNRFVEDDHFGIFINVKALPRLRNITHHFQVLPVSQTGAVSSQLSQNSLHSSDNI